MRKIKTYVQKSFFLWYNRQKVRKMDLFEKLTILSDAAKYDVSCSSSGSSRANKGGMGNGHVSGICHSWSEDGRCISLLKVLMTNHCVFDCTYCLNRRSNHVPRAAFSPDELVDLTLEFYRRNYIEGLFLSSGIYPNIDETSERMVQVAKKLRERGFYGYIHMKIIPGTDAKLVAQLGSYIDRASVNIELPSTRSLALLAPQKTQKSIMGPMRQISETLLDQEEGRKGKKKPRIKKVKLKAFGDIMAHMVQIQYAQNKGGGDYDLVENKLSNY